MDLSFEGNFVNLTRIIKTGALVSAIVSPAVMAADNSASMSPAQTKEIQKIIHDYIVANPEVLVEASQALQQKQQQAMQQQAQGAIVQNADQLFNDNMTVMGNPKGNVTLVEFFDYQCIHCKKIAPVIDSLIKKNSNLRVIFKEFPIFGESSDMASRAALAASMQGKYMAMHDALLGQEKHLNEEIVNQAAQSIGLDMNKFKIDMASQQVQNALQANRELAEKLHLMGTPAIIIASTPNGQLKKGTEPTFIPGAAGEDTLNELIKKAQ